MAELISWETASHVAARVARQQTPLSAYELQSLETDFQELTARAEELVAAETGLRSLAGPARARVADRAQWVDANVASFQRLLRPVIDKLTARVEGSGRLSPLPLKYSRQLAGAEVGLVLGWMSTRVLGQYDQLIIEDENPEDQDIVYYVGPNIVSLERRYGFPPREFRLWLALHEVTHRAQFTGVPWMRGHFLSLVEASVGAVDPDPKRLLEAIRRAVDIVRDGRNPLNDGLIALLASAEQQVTLNQVQGLMSLLEGHGDITMDRAAADRIPSADRFSRVLRQRRQEARGPLKLVQQAIGLDAKLRQYEEGEQFIQAVEHAGGPALLHRVWDAPDNLPTLEEIRQPELWINRLRSRALA
jgi:coenzyme F420 biosynthesis associated uncharacterized protein